MGALLGEAEEKIGKSLEVCDEVTVVVVRKDEQAKHYYCDTCTTILLILLYRQLRGVNKGQPVCQSHFDK